MASVRDPQRTFGLPGAWWPVAFGDEVSSAPRAYRLGDRRLALFRDSSGAVRAVEDICPHRRLPLSMGRLTDEGHLQCGYHGWCFDGASGQCVAIPNFDAQEKVSPSIRVPAFDAALADGFVHVWTGSDPSSDPSTAEIAHRAPAAGAPRAARGEVEARAPHERIAEALLWNPGRALGLGLLLGEGEEVVDAHMEQREDAVEARRERLVVDLPRLSTFDPLVRRAVAASVTTHAHTGLTHVVVPGGRVVVGLSPMGSYRTVVRWSVGLVGSGGRASLAAARLVRMVRHPARGVAAAIEAVADDVEGAIDAAVDRLRALRELRVDA